MFIAESVSEKKFKINEYLAKIQPRTWLPRALYAPGHHTAKKTKKVHETTTFLL